MTLYERPGCHLCEEAAETLAPLLERLRARLVRVNVAADAALEERYGLAIPVIAVEGREVTRAPIDLDSVRAAIAGAASRKTSSPSN